MQMGALDFAGGTVVHISLGISALICALVIGKRLGYGQNAMPPHNLTYTVIGAAMLWIGWFGFNAGSALEANGFAARLVDQAHNILLYLTTQDPLHDPHRLGIGNPHAFDEFTFFA